MLNISSKKQPFLPFIHSLTNTQHGEVNIHLATCKFNLENYQDDWYERLNIYFPPVTRQALKKRKAEFLAGRYVAKEALTMMRNNPDFIVRSDPYGCPLWPVGLSGSITHKRDTAICAIAKSREVQSVGVDLEEWLCHKTAENIWQSVVNQKELDVVYQLGLNFSQAITLAFSAKEAIFKAIYPYLKCYVDFSFVQIVGLENETKRLRVQLSELSGGKLFDSLDLYVSWKELQSYLFTLVFIKN